MFGRKRIEQLKKDLEFADNELKREMMEKALAENKLFFAKKELKESEEMRNYDLEDLKCKLLGAEFFGDCNLVSNKQVIDIFEELK